MSTPAVLGTSTVRVTHHVHLRHASTGLPLAPLTASVELPPGWWLRVRGADVVVSSRDGAPAPAPPAPPLVLRVEVADPVLALLVQTPAVDVPLTAPSVVLDVPPVPMTLAVELSTDSTGAPRTGRAVVARATAGPAPRATVALPEVAPGLYRSAPTVWTTAMTPLDLLVAGVLLRQVTVDFSRTETRIRLVDTT